MSKHFDFEYEPPADEEAPVPVTFTVFGEGYTCVPVWPAGVVFDVIGASPALGGKRLDTASELQLLGRFYDSVLEPESHERFEEAMHRPKNPITIPMAIRLYHQMIEAYSLHPTGGSSESSDGPETTGPSSTDEPPAPEPDGTP